MSLGFERAIEPSIAGQKTLFANNWQIGRVWERASSGPEGLLKKAERVLNVATAPRNFAQRPLWVIICHGT
jgi:hypothetical protein